ncbi:MAG: phosphatidate cytidylyltransferase, partial [Myxococcales bacterium]|nr:phosphatidate cytidylyltransferase [Myxococcales bacterium]
WYAVSIHAPDQTPAFFAVWMPCTMIFVTLRPGEDIGRSADRLARHVMGVAWLGLLPMLVRLRMLPDGLAWIFVVLGIAWLSDTGAYFAGRSFGKRKLYERISPKKTVEGMVGGMVTSTVGLWIITSIGLPQATWIDVLAFGTIGTAAGVLGDLSESMLKRAFGVKDSGTIMPGHGGLLDRIDSVLFVGAFVFAYVTFLFR